MTKREWENRWRGRLKLNRPDEFYNVYTTQGFFYYIHEVDGEYLFVSRDRQSRRDKRVKLHRRDLVRIIS